MLKINQKLIRLGDTIFNNSLGVNNNISFTFKNGKNLNNYTRMKIFSKIVFAGYTLNTITEVPVIVGGTISINSSRMHADSTWINDIATYVINSNSLVKSHESDVRIVEGNAVQFTKNTSRTLITKIVAYCD